MGEVETRGVCVRVSGATSVKSLKGSEPLLSMSPLEAATALTGGSLDDLQLAVKHMDLCRNVEDMSVGLVIAGDLGCQASVVRASCHLHGLVVGRRLPRDDVDEPHASGKCKSTYLALMCLETFFKSLLRQ